jgi:hypothetical protein
MSTEAPKHGRNRNRRANHRARGHLNALSPSAQMKKVMADQDNLRDGRDLRKWSASARKELNSSLTVTGHIKADGKITEVQLPCLVFLAASPTFRTHVENGEKQLIFNHPYIYVDAVKAISKWLRRVCDERAFPELPVPEDLIDGLKVRQTAIVLGMRQYVEHIEERYIQSLGDRVPTVDEVNVVIDYSYVHFDIDPIVVALAKRLSQICRDHEVEQEQEIVFGNMLVGGKFVRVLNAVKEDKGVAMAKQEYPSRGRKTLR